MLFATAGDSLAALIHYRNAIELPHTQIWSFVHAANCHCSNGEHEQAFEVLRKAKEKWSGNREYRRQINECIESFFWDRASVCKTYSKGGPIIDARFV